MTKQISTRDWEALSAFLDGQLAPKDQRRLEARLESSPELQHALKDLERTRTMLRSQPKMRAPRNFTLTTQMVEKYTPARPVSRAYPVFRLASAFASLLLVLVLIGDYFSGAPAIVGSSGQYLTAQERAAASSAPPGMGAASAPAEAASAVTEAPPSMSLEMAGTPEPEAKALSEEARNGETVEAPSLAAAPNLEAQPETSDPEIMAAPSEEISGQEALDTAAPDREAARPISPIALRMIEALLAVLVIVSGAAAYFLRRSTSG
jgi:hypothetical protein